LGGNNNYCIIGEFGVENYFKYKLDVKLLEKLYPSSLSPNLNTPVKPDDEISFLKYCSTQDNQIEIREKLIYIHRYITQLKIND